MKCPACGSAELLRDTRDVPVRHDGKTVLIPSVNGDYCPACGEVLLNAEQGDRYIRLIACVRRGEPPSCHLRLVDTIAQCDLNAPPPADLRSWDESPPAGKEVL